MQLETEDLIQDIKALLPNAEFGEDDNGEFIIFTNMMEIGPEQNPSIAEGDTVLVPFVPEEPSMGSQILNAAAITAIAVVGSAAALVIMNLLHNWAASR